MTDHVKLSDQDLERVGGGTGSWRDFSKGDYVNYGQYIEYTVAPGDVLSGIANRFGVTINEIQQWNNITDPDAVSADQKLTIYARTLR